MENHNYKTTKNLETVNDTHESSSTAKKTTAIIAGVAAVAIIGVAGLYLVDVDQTQEARLPDVDVSVAEGQMPKFDMDVADVNLQVNDSEIKVPTMGVETETHEIEVPVGVETGSTGIEIKVPSLDITPPAEDNPADNPTD